MPELDDVTGVLPAAGSLTGAEQILVWKNGQASVTTITALLGIGTPIVETTQTGTTYTFALTDAETMVNFTAAGGIIAALPTNASVAFPVGTVIDVRQMGAGNVFPVGIDGSVTVSPSGVHTRVVTSVLSLEKTATNTWVISGDYA